MGYFDNYTFRCSSLGNIVPKSGKPTKELNSFLYSIFIEEVFGRKKLMSNKYFSKGVFCEEDGITMLQKAIYKDKFLVVKNKERKNNGFINGECDVDLDDTITDIKNAWDIETLFKSDLTHEYRLQLIGYCWLWGRRKARLFYSLNNLPEFMVEDEKSKLFYSNKYYYINAETEQYKKDAKVLEQSFSFDNLPLEDRFRVWEFEVTANDIEIIEEAVLRARRILNSMYESYEDVIKKNRLITN